MGIENTKARPSTPLLVIAAVGLALGLLFIAVACQAQGGWTARFAGSSEQDGLSVSDYPLDEAFIADMISKRPDSYEHSYTYMAADGEDSVRILDVVERAGVRYELRDVAATEEDNSWERPVKTVTVSVTKSVPASDVQNALRYFPADMSYEQDGFAGTLTRGVQVSSQAETEVLTRQVDRVVSFTGLPNNDASSLPQTQSFEVSSADGTVVKALDLSDVTYQVESWAPDGTPASYTATANYRGVEDYLTTPGYAITYVYDGELASTDTQMVIRATYDAVLPWGEALVGIVAFGPVSAVSNALSKSCA